MLISIIVPVYNVSSYLKQCIDSILSQDFKEYEVLLIDDGSKDDSGRICDAYAKMYEQIKSDT
ncbi:glycosyltransferase family 2 protein [Cellulosilyticum ruminicola]|uniref:glycosyltransferase family 2 protein n=1 Tax=Cellulosilyticum ruminicola TaxID=425254 RepID=UPI0009FB1D62|nr:glycosyltransferase family 2 protein [Cellulosilyticum ruminicola]